MDIPYHEHSSAVAMTRTVEMQTSHSMGRIIYAGFPEIESSLSRAQQYEARRRHIACIHRALLQRPFLDDSAYCAVLQPKTWLVGPGPEQAHMGYFLHPGDSLKSFEYSALAVSRFLVDNQQNPTIFPQGHLLHLQKDPTSPDNGEVELRLHSPFGLLRAVMPVTRNSIFGLCVTDPARDIRFWGPSLSAQDLFLEIKIPMEHRWPSLVELGWDSIIVGVAFIGCHVIVLSPHQLGFTSSGQSSVADIDEMEEAKTKAFLAIDNDTIVRKWARQSHPANITDPATTHTIAKFFAQTERSQRNTTLEWVESGTYAIPPDGGNNQAEDYVRVSVIEARLALAVAQGEARLGDTWVFPRSEHGDDSCGCDLSAKVVAGGEGFDGCFTVEIAGRAQYVGSSTVSMDRC